MADAVETIELQIVSEAKTAEQSIDALIATLNKLGQAVSSGLGLDALAADVKAIRTEVEKTRSTTTKGKKSFLMFGATLGMVTRAASLAGAKIGEWIDSSNSYVENVNLFTVAMGEYADEAKSYANTVGEIMGIDPSEWIRNQGLFMTLSTGFGNVADRAAIMSKNLTQLGYDLSSFYNISVKDAMLKLQSGFAGELEPLRRLGYDLSEARLEATAASLGIGKLVSSMTQAEKAELRYYAIMTQNTKVQGDFARTLEQPANQLRVFKAQVEQAARALGNIFIPALNAVLPYAIALAQVVRLAANALATLFGFEFPEVDYSSLNEVSAGASSASDAMDEATGSAKKLRKMLLGIDEINVMSEKSSSGGTGGAGAGSGAGFDFDLPEYDFIGEAAANRVTEIVNKVRDFLGLTEEIDSWSEFFDTNLGKILTTVLAVGAGIAAWKIASGFTTTLSLLAGIALTVAGAVILVTNFVDALNNGVDWDNLIGIISGAALIVGGLAIAFGTVGAAIGLVIAGVALLIVGIKDWIDTGELSNESFVAVVAGIMAIGGAIALLTGNWIPLLVAGVAALLVAIVTRGEEIKAFLGKINDWVQNVFGRDWTELFGPIMGTSMNLFFASFTALWQGVTDILSGVIDIIAGVFTGDWERAWDGVVGVFKGIVNAVISLINGMVKAVVNGVNSVIRALNRIQVRIPDWVPALGGKSFGFNIRQLTAPQIPLLETGGIVKAGQAFIAREAGPEIVGNVGRRTAVMNNDQIVEAVSQGVYKAVMAANGGNRGSEIKLIVGGRQLMVTVAEEARRETMRTGVNPLGV